MERSDMKRDEELVQELIEAVKHLAEQFPESDLGYPTVQVNYEGDWIEGHIDDSLIWALERVQDLIEEFEKFQERN
jgi:hypothetical protein